MGASKKGLPRGRRGRDRPFLSEGEEMSYGGREGEDRAFRSEGEDRAFGSEGEERKKYQYETGKFKREKRQVAALSPSDLDHNGKETARTHARTHPHTYICIYMYAYPAFIFMPVFNISLLVHYDTKNTYFSD